jgi:moderate conductance mechanosensitive channel
VRIIGHASAGAGVPGLVTLLRRRRGGTDADRLRAFGSARRAQRARTVGSVIGNAATILIFGTAFTMALGQVGVNLAPVLASAGVLGLAVGFGAQNLVRDFLSGIFMLLEDQYGIGDTVDLGEARGTVEKITLRTTVLRGQDGTVWHVPNGEVVRVGNQSQLWSVAVLDITVAPTADIEQTSRIVAVTAERLTTSEDYAADVISPPEMLGVESIRPEATTLRLLVKTKPGSHLKLQRALRVEILRELTNAGVPFPAPYGTLPRPDEPPVP